MKISLPVINALVILLCFFIFSFTANPPQKINGIYISPPEREVNTSFIKSLKKTHANYIELNPVAFSKPNKPMVFYDKPTQNWGEREDGIEAMMDASHANGFKVFLNPKVFIAEVGAPSNFNLKDDVTWKKWEANYSRFILAYATFAQQNKAELFSIGSNFNNAVLVRKQFWMDLIQQVRRVYAGKITYAASYTDADSIPFWSELDYIGVNAYYPLSAHDTPGVKDLMAAWQKPKQQLLKLSEHYNRQVLFTEWGYRSINKCAWKQDELPDDFIYEGHANRVAQAVAYACLLTVLKNENRFAGGFCFKWYNDTAQGGSNNNDFTPQNKLAEEVLSKAYRLGEK